MAPKRKKVDIPTEFSNIQPEPITINGTQQTSAEEIRARRNDPNISFMQGQQLTPPKKERGGVYANHIDSLGFRPVEVAVSSFELPGGQPLHIPAGFYLLTGTTGGGKSITAAALALFAKAAGCGAKYFYCYEARVPDSDKGGEKNPFYSASEANADQDLNRSRFGALFREQVVKLKDTQSKAFPASIVVVDSIALPLRVFRSPDRRGAATMKEGLQPMDIEFVVLMEEHCVQNNIACFGVVNADLVPFANKLEGMAEGLLQVTAPGSFTLRSRKERQNISYTLPPDAVDAAAMYLRYDEKGRQRSRPFLGIQFT